MTNHEHHKHRDFIVPIDGSAAVAVQKVSVYYTGLLLCVFFRHGRRESVKKQNPINYQLPRTAGALNSRRDTQA